MSANVTVWSTTHLTHGEDTTNSQRSMPTTSTQYREGTGPITWDDATWILTSAFIIFTMQSGFGLLEAGVVSVKNEVNIMVKNAIDVVFGGITYWAFGFGISFGLADGSNPFCGVGYFLMDSTDESMGLTFSTFVFQLSFATTATTIVSGAMAERTKLTTYILFSLLNTVIYVFPAHWIWGENGFLRTMGCIDIAGSGAVHMVGGFSSLIAAYLLGPRLGRYDNGYESPPMGNPANTMIGMFMLWWGWLGFNCGSTFGISKGKWILASKAAVTTLNASMGGGTVGVVISYITKNRKYDVSYLVNSILGGLVSITAPCAVVRTWEALIIGGVGGGVTIVSALVIDRLKVDDPVAAVSVHGIAGIWGMLAVGLFVDVDQFQDMTMGRKGLFHGGGSYLLGVQALACVSIIAWSTALTFIILIILKYTVGIRLTEEEEILGADYVEHGITSGVDSRMLFSRRRSTLFKNHTFAQAGLNDHERSNGHMRPESVTQCTYSAGTVTAYPEHITCCTIEQELPGHCTNQKDGDMLDGHENSDPSNKCEQIVVVSNSHVCRRYSVPFENETCVGITNLALDKSESV